jgi:thymidylate kinase
MSSSRATQDTERERPSRGALVCLVGMDGSGKSTLAKALRATLEERGLKSRYVYGGFTSSFTILRPVIALVRATLFRGDTHYQDSQTKGRVLKDTTLSTLYQYLALADYILQATFRIRLPLALGWNVVCDRYIYDLAVGIGVLLDYPTARTLTLLRRCLLFLPRPHLIFLLDLPESLAYQRKDDIVSVDFLKVRREIYLEMARHHEITVLNASSSPEHLQQVVTARVLNLIEGEA